MYRLFICPPIIGPHLEGAGRDWNHVRNGATTGVDCEGDGDGPWAIGGIAVRDGDGGIVGPGTEAGGLIVDHNGVGLAGCDGTSVGVAGKPCMIVTYAIAQCSGPLLFNHGLCV